MKLTNQQIEIIDQTLVLNGLIYEDIKLEITDHIASEIEVEMNEKKIPFEEALILVFENWSMQLKRTKYGFLLGRQYSGPKIIMDKTASYVKSRLLYILLGSIPLTGLSFLIIYGTHPEAMKIIFTNSVRIIYLLEVFFVVVSWILIVQSKAKTTYSYLFKKRSLLVFVQPLFIGIGLMPLTSLFKGSIAMQLTLIYTFIALALFFLLDFSLVINHLKLVRKYKIYP
ncbi:MAG: hypothetical protein ABI554_02580 [Flavobacterium sp.]